MVQGKSTHIRSYPALLPQVALLHTTETYTQYQVRLFTENVWMFKIQTNTIIVDPNTYKENGKIINNI